MQIEAVQHESVKRSFAPVAAMVLATGVILMFAGALNGGTDLSTGAWDVFVTTIKSVLGSTMIMALALIAIFVTVWQLAHGQGYRNLMVVLGILIIPLIGPSFLTTVATATGMPTASSNDTGVHAMLDMRQ